MGAAISYMGTKRELAGDVAEAIATCRSGPVLDAFAGMCSVGEAVGTSRQVWVNDAQTFASEVGRALFTSRIHPLSAISVANVHHSSFQENFARGCATLTKALMLEDHLLASETFEDFTDARAALRAELDSVSRLLIKEHHNLFARIYADTFFGVRQSIEIDAIVKSIGWTGSEFNKCDQSRWSIISLGRSMLRISNSTGHFAQYLLPKHGNYKSFLRQRRRRVWSEWVNSHDEVSPVGCVNWRSANKAFNQDALKLFDYLERDGSVPSVVYADPPYTNDQYSRYYHIFETLALYDYPKTSGKGLYREGRFSTSFSLKSRAAESIALLARAVRGVGADLVLSYPTNGLAYGKDFDPVPLLRKFYRSVETFRSIAHDHSTLGASKGAAKARVIEKIYVARV